MAGASAVRISTVQMPHSATDCQLYCDVCRKVGWSLDWLVTWSMNGNVVLITKGPLLACIGLFVDWPKLVKAFVLLSGSKAQREAQHGCLAGTWGSLRG